MPNQETTITQYITGGEGHHIAGRDQYFGFTAKEVAVLYNELHEKYERKRFDGTSPYVGLKSFQKEDADRFFGREKLTKGLVARVQHARFLVIAGPSGSGKSSLARAGLIPALKTHKMKGSEHWLHGILTPGRHPLNALAGVVESVTKNLDAGD